MKRIPQGLHVIRFCGNYVEYELCLPVKELDAYLLSTIGYTTECYDFIFINLNIYLFIGLPDHTS